MQSPSSPVSKSQPTTVYTELHFPAMVTFGCDLLRTIGQITRRLFVDTLRQRGSMVGAGRRRTPRAQRTATKHFEDLSETSKRRADVGSCSRFRCGCDP